MYILGVYIEGVRVTLFEDENVSLFTSIQNIKDISKVFTDFTQSFSIPANPNNNAIFEHWYNADIINGFDAKVRKSAALELDFAPFKTGKIQLDSVKLNHGKPQSYKITFFGDLVNLSDLFGDDKLSDLDLSAYNHAYTPALVLEGIQGTLAGGSVIYPLISSNRNWQWDAQSTAFSVDDIKYPGNGSSGISYDELKPAIKINRIIEAIETKYGITISDNFFNTTNHIDELFLWLNAVSDDITAYSAPKSAFFNIQFNGEIEPFSRFSFYLTPEAGFETVPYKVIVTNKDCGDTREFENLTGGDLDRWVGLGLCNDQSIGLYDIDVSSTQAFDFQMDYFLVDDGSPAAGSSGVVSIPLGGAFIDNELQMPNIKVSDFIGGLIKMFNLVVEPLSSTSFNILPLDEWYAEGVARDITDYVDITEVVISKPNLYKRIDFSYEESDAILGAEFLETNGRGYGDLEAEFVYDGGVLEINVPFYNLMQERLTSVLDNSLSDMHVGKVIDIDLNPTEIAPTLFYNRGTTNLTTGFGYIDAAGVQTEVNAYLNTGQDDKLIYADITQSLNFGEDISTWHYSVPPTNPNSDSSLSYSLYSNYWEDYITDLYDNKRREYLFRAILPLAIAKSIRLNDILRIRDRIYTINDIQTNLTTGEVKLNLLNYIGVIPNEIPKGFVGLNYDLNFDIS